MRTTRTPRTSRPIRHLAAVAMLMVLALIGAACSNTPPSSEALIPTVPQEDVGPESAETAESADNEDTEDTEDTEDIADSEPVPEDPAAPEDPVAPAAPTEPAAPDTLPEGWDPFGGPSTDEAPTDDPPAVPAAPVTESVPETLAFSADATADFATMLFDLEIEMGMNEGVLTMNGQGAVDGSTTAMQVSFGGMFDSLFEGSGVDDLAAQSMTVVADGQNTFVKWKVLSELAGIGDAWVYTPIESDEEVLVDDALFDPSTFLDMLYSADDDVKEVGTKTIDGFTVTGFSGSFNVEDAQLQNYVDNSGGAQLDDVETTVWISDDDLVRQIESDFALEGIYYRSTITFSAYGEPVNIEVPRLEDSVALSDLEDALG